MSQSHPWTSDELRHLWVGRMNLPLKPYKLIAEELGREEAQCRFKFAKTDWEKMGLSADAEQMESRFVAKSKFTGKIVDQLSKRHSIAQVRGDAISDAIERSLQALPKAAPPAYKPSKKKDESGPEDVGLILSDLHVGHEHTLEETGGISEYNHKMYVQRMKNLTYAVPHLCERHLSYTKLPTLRVFCLGDIVAGMNAAGAWSHLYIGAPIVDQMMDGFHTISEAIYYWLGFFETIEFYGIAGNHGRTAPQGLQKDHDNWDYVCYKFLETHFRNNPRVKFHVPKSWWLMEKVRGHNFLMVHGDYTKSGSPINSLTKFYEKMGGIVKERADYVLAGHYHNSAEQTVNGARILLNGSFVGSDVYSLRNVHAASPAEQKLFGIHDGHGITWSYNINLDTPRK